MKLATILVLIFLALAPPYDQCDQINFARANPGLCYEGPLGSFPGGGGAPVGGGGSGGLLGTIGRVLGGLTGGLL